MIPGTSLTYAQLWKNFAPRPITNDDKYWATQAVIDGLLAKQRLSKDEATYLDLLSLLMKQYDKERETVPELRGVDLLEMLIEESELKQRDLLSIFRHESVISDVLARRRRLTVAQIDGLAVFFELPHQLFFEMGRPLPAVPQEHAPLLQAAR